MKGFLLTALLAVFGIAVSGRPARPAAAPPAAPTGLKEALDEFRAFCRKGMADAGVVGGSILVLRGGEVVAGETYGTADRERGLPVDGRTIFHWASITKTLTGIAVMQLRDRGLLSLDDPIVKYVPELRQVRDPFGDAGEITLRHLLTHSAGFRSGTWPWRDAEWQPFEPTRWEQLAAMLPYTEVQFRPGSRWSYSNPAIIFLGRAIELLTGDDYEVYVDKNVFKPLGMHGSYFDATPYHLLPHRARSYFRKGAETTAAPFDVDSGITVSNSGWNAPLGDLQKYLGFLMGDPDPARQAVYDGVLKRASLEEMFRPVLPVTPEKASPPADAGVEESQGLAFRVEKRFGRTAVGHSGDQNGFISHLYVVPADRVGYVVAYNTLDVPESEDFVEGGSVGALDRAIRDRVFSTIFPLLAAPKAGAR